MFDLSKSYLGNVVAYMQFERDQKLRLKQERFEELFKPLIGVGSVNANVPDEAPPQIPRLAMSNPEKRVRVIASQMSVQLEADFPIAPGTLSNALQEARKLVNAFHAIAREFREQDDLDEKTLVLKILCPDERPFSDLSPLFAAKYLRLPDIGEIVSALFKVAVARDDKLFVNLAADVYKLDLVESDNPKWPVTKETPGAVEQSGLLMQVDVNNKLELIRTGSIASITLDELFSVAQQQVETGNQRIFGL